MKDKFIFLKRFNKFQDCLLEEILVSYSKEGTKIVSLKLYAKDWDDQNNDTWLSVQLEFLDILSFKIFDDFLTTHQVISNGISILLEDNKVIVDMGDLADEIISISDLDYSNFFIVCKDIRFNEY